MQTKASVILHFSILFIAVYYYNKVDKVWLKRAVLAFGVYALSGVLKDFLPWKYVFTIIGLLTLTAAFVFSWLEVSRSQSIERADKIGIKVFLLPVILCVSMVLFKPVVFLALPMVFLSIAILVYYTFKYQNSDYLTQELTIMNLFGIDFILSLVKVFFVFYH